MSYGLLGLVGLVLLVYCVLDVLRTPEPAVRGLPKLLWLVVVLFPIAGGIAWLLAGRPVTAARTTPPGTGPKGRKAAPHPDDDEEFIRGLRKRAAEQRRRAEQERGQEDQPPA